MGTHTIKPLSGSDRTDWESLYRGYAEFYNMPMNDEILNTLWSWIHDQNNAFFALIARVRYMIAWPKRRHGRLIRWRLTDW